MIATNLHKEKLITNLSPHRALDSLFREELLKRMDMPGWAANPLIQVILMSEAKYLQPGDSYYGSIDEKARKAIRAKYNGHDSTFDSKLYDELACGHAYLLLKDEGFQDIRVVSDANRRSPKADLEATKGNNSYLIEVTRIMASDVESYLSSELTALHINDPETFDKRILVKASGFTRELPTNDDGRKDKVELSNIIARLKMKGFSNLPPVFSWGEGSKERSVEIRVDATKPFSVVVRPSQMVYIDPTYRAKTAAELMRKMAMRINEKVAQLAGTDPSNSSLHIIFIQLDLASSDMLIPEVVKQVVDIIEGPFKDVIDPKLRIVVRGNR